MVKRYDANIYPDNPYSFFTSEISDLDEWKDLDLSFLTTKYYYNKFYTKMFSDGTNIFPSIDYLRATEEYKAYPYTLLEFYFAVEKIGFFNS